jgi:hypothetical protein
MITLPASSVRSQVRGWTRLTKPAAKLRRGERRIHRGSRLFRADAHFALSAPHGAWIETDPVGAVRGCAEIQDITAHFGFGGNAPTSGAGQLPSDRH